MISLLRRPSAWVPMLLSLAALALVAGYALTVGVGVGRDQDEGTAARTFQLTMLAVALAIAFFAVRWLPVAPMAAMRVLVLQLLIAAVPVITILLLER